MSDMVTKEGVLEWAEDQCSGPEECDGCDCPTTPLVRAAPKPKKPRAAAWLVSGYRVQSSHWRGTVDRGPNIRFTKAEAMALAMTFGCTITPLYAGEPVRVGKKRATKDRP